MNSYPIIKCGQNVAHACQKCGKRYLFSSLSVEDKAKKLAEQCCRNDCCAQCGATIHLGLGGVHCAQCVEFNIVKKAKHIPDNEYKGLAVFTEDVPNSDSEYYFDDDLYQRCDDEGVEPPCYVYACNPVPFELDVFAYIESEFEAHTAGIDDIDDIDDFTDGKQLMELCGKLSDWAAKQPVFYKVDTKLVIVLDDERFQKYLKENDQKTCNIN